jgi:HAE1 family hydrophobic/amphiphilic exporter-1
MDLKNIPLRAPNLTEPTTLGAVMNLTATQTPTEVDHYQIQRITDVYVTPAERTWARSRMPFEHS